jgi:hypothetical protein
MRLVRSGLFLLYEKEAVGLVHSCYEEQGKPYVLAYLLDKNKVSLCKLDGSSTLTVRPLREVRRMTLSEWLNNPVRVLNEYLAEHEMDRLCPNEDTLTEMFLKGKVEIDDKDGFIRDLIRRPDFDMGDLTLDLDTLYTCYDGHTFCIDDRVRKQCVIEGLDHITCGFCGCEQTIPIRVLDHVKHRFNPPTIELIKECHPL